MFFVLTAILKYGNFWLRGCLAVTFLSLGMYAQAKPLKGDSTGRKVMTCAMPGVPGTVNGSTCGPGNVTLTAYPTPPGANPAIMKPMMAQPQSLPGGGGTITYTTRWYYASSGGTYFAEGTTQTFNVSSTTTYYVSTRSSAGCESARVPITATVVTIDPANAGANQSLCRVGATTLTATSPAYGSGAWSVYSGPSTSPSQFSSTGNPTATFTPAGGAGTYVLTWKVTNASCTSSSNVTLSFTNTPTTANAGPYQNGSSTCGLTSVALAANTPTVGAGRWSVAPDSPTQTGYSFGNTNSPTTSFSGIAGGNYDLVWTITNGACTSTSDTFILFNQNPSPAQAGSNQTICVNSSATLGANTPTVGSGAWSVSSGPSTSPSQFSSTGNPTATFTPAGGAGTYTLTWTISKSPCAASASNMTVTVNAVPTAANAGADQTGSATCGLTSVTLAANTPGTGTGNWSIVSGAGGTVTSPGSANSSFSGTAGSAYTLRWTTSNGVCSSSADDVQVAFNRVPSTSSAGADQAVCGLTQVTLAASTPTLGGGSWSIVSGAGGTVTSPGSASSTFSGTAGSTYTLRWTVSNSPCTASTDDLAVTFNKNPTPANAGSDYSQCGLEGKTLAANTPTVGTGAWSVVSGPSSSQGQFSSPASPAAVFTPAGGAGSYVLQWTINNAGCVSTSNVTLTFTDAPTVSHAGSDRTDSTTCGLTSVTLAANPPTVGTGRWSVAPDSPTGTGYSFGNTNSPTSTFSGIAGGTYDLVWTVTNGSCTSTSEIYVTFWTPPTVAASAAPTICSGTNIAVVLTNNVPATNTWTVVQTNVSGATSSNASSNTSSPYTYTLVQALTATSNVAGTATYTVTPSANGCSGSPITVSATVNPVPVIAITGNNQYICSGNSTGINISNTNNVAGTTYSWSLAEVSSYVVNVSGVTNTTATSIIQNPIVTNTTDTGVVEYAITGSANNCTSAVAYANVYVNPTAPEPSPPLVSSNDCGTKTLSYNGTPPSGTSWYWQGTNATGQDYTSTVATSATYSAPSSGTYWLASRNSYGCWGGNSVAVTVNPLPTASAANQAIFSGQATSVQFTNTNNVPGTIYSWTVSSSSNVSGAAAGVGSSITQNISINNGTSGSVTYNVTPSANGCAGPVFTPVVTVYPVPVITPPQAYVVKGTNITLDIGPGYSSYRWFKDTGSLSDQRTMTTSQTGTYSCTVTMPGGATHTQSYTVNSQFSGVQMNYVVTNTALVSGISDPAALENLPVEQVNQSVGYFDGLGRLVQTVITQGSPLKNDLVTPTTYDAFGREPRKYLPVSLESNGRYKNILMGSDGNYTNVLNYNNNEPDKVIDDTRPFSETIFEPSPLNRPSKNYGPGLGWKNPEATPAIDLPVIHAYLINDNTQEQIICWKIDPYSNLPVLAPTTGSAVLNGYYATGQLSVKSTKDEQGNEVREYTDNLGHVVLKKVQAVTQPVLNNNAHWAQTYYIYDDLGRLTFVLSPEAVKALTN